MSDLHRGFDYIGVTVSYLCHDGQGNYLLNKRSQNCRDEHGCWDPGGGAVEFGETIEEALKKEIKEEYCVEVTDYEFLGYKDIFRTINGRKSHWLSLVYKVLVERDKVKNGEPHKFDEIDWFTLDNLPSPLHSQLPEAIEMFKSQL